MHRKRGRKLGNFSTKRLRSRQGDREKGRGAGWWQHPQLEHSQGKRPLAVVSAQAGMGSVRFRKTPQEGEF